MMLLLLLVWSAVTVFLSFTFTFFLFLNGNISSFFFFCDCLNIMSRCSFSLLYYDKSYMYAISLIIVTEGRMQQKCRQ